jgi:sugar lactone lactonase YvrE
MSKMKRALLLIMRPIATLARRASGSASGCRRAPRLVLCIALALGAAGCAQVPVTPQVQAPAELVWPRPPAPARVRFVRNVATPADWGVSRSPFQAFMDKVTGQRPFRFIRPTGVAARGSVLYVADPGAQALVVFDTAQGHDRTIARIDGERLASPVAVALGRGDTVFLVDSALRKVFVLDAEGRSMRSIGGEGRLARPAGVAYDAVADRLYVSDAATHRIIVFSADGRMLESFGANGTGLGEFNFPTHLALTREGDLLVTDTLNFRVQVLARNGRPITAFGRAGDGSGDFAAPKGIGADSVGNIFVVDALFDAVQVFGRDGSLLLGFGERGTQAGRFWLPNGLFIDPSDNVYVADSYNQRISIFERVQASAPRANE